jgi:hypothetical protein
MLSQQAALSYVLWCAMLCRAVLCCAVLFRPMKHLIEQVAAGYTYKPVTRQDVGAYNLNQQQGQVRLQGPELDREP